MADPLCHGTTVIYNEHEIRNVLTESMDTTTVYDSTGVDPIGLRTKMTFIGEIHALGAGQTMDDNLHGFTWSPPTDTIAPGLYNIIQQFLRPRQELYINVGQDQLFYIRPGAVANCKEPAPVAPVGGNWDNYDIANGPHTTCQVIAVKGSRSAKCRFSVEFTTQLQCSQYQDQGYVLNIRWRVHDDIDCRTWLTRRTYEGAIRFRARFTDVDGVNPHDVARVRAFPPLLRGFRRETVAYHEEPNALEISFIVIDQETYSAAPSPATFWDGTYTVTMAQGAVTNTQNLSFTLKGDPIIKKTDLFTLAMYIIDSKLQMRINRAPGEAAPNFLLMSAMFQERLPENEINVSVTTWSASSTPDENATGERFLANMSQSENPSSLLGKQFTLGQELPKEVSAYPSIPTGYYKYHDPKIATVPIRWPQAVSFLLCNLQNPCCPESLTSRPVGTKAGYPIIGNYGGVSRQEPITYSLAKTLYSASHTKSSYEYYKMSSDLVTDTGWRAFPLGTQCSSSSDAATVAFAHLHCPVQVRKITINAMRINAWPELPKPIHWEDDTVSPAVKHILRDYTIEPMPVQLSADGCDSLHEVVATYYYYLDRPYQVTSAYKMPVGRLPYVSKAKLAATNPKTEQGDDANKQAIDQMYFIHPKELLATVP